MRGGGREDSTRTNIRWLSPLTIEEEIGMPLMVPTIDVGVLGVLGDAALVAAAALPAAPVVMLEEASVVAGD